MKKKRHEIIFCSSSECPVIVCQRRDNASHSTLAYHREWEFQFILKGKGFYFIAGKKYAFRPNTVFAINPDHVHYYALTPGYMMWKWTLMFLPAILRDLSLKRALSAIPHQVPLTDLESAAVVLLLCRLKNELSRQEAHWREIVSLKLEEFLWLLKRAGGRTSPMPVVSPLAKQLTDYIEQHFTQDFSVPELAERFGYSEGYLAHVFKRHTQFGIKHYLLQRRIVEARRQLEENPRMKTASVAENVGFKDFGVFNRMFKLLVGITPAVYSRNSHLNSSI
ncbi:MAG: AraC family transcriptional regulator [Kiritimatiellia bacterium]|nr:AraC family transcriptional regulator [Kiritimatiellia bacterium]